MGLPQLLAELAFTTNQNGEPFMRPCFRGVNSDSATTLDSVCGQVSRPNPGAHSHNAIRAAMIARVPDSTSTTRRDLPLRAFLPINTVVDDFNLEEASC